MFNPVVIFTDFIADLLSNFMLSVWRVVPWEMKVFCVVFITFAVWWFSKTTYRFVRYILDNFADFIADISWTGRQVHKSVLWLGRVATRLYYKLDNFVRSRIEQRMMQPPAAPRAARVRGRSPGVRFRSSSRGRSPSLGGRPRSRSFGLD
jgi:hypothetical protein